MRLAFHSATTMTSDIETDVAVAAHAGFKSLEIWASKLDTYFKTHSLSDLRGLFHGHAVEPLAINSIEFIAFQGGEYGKIQSRLHQLGKIAQYIGCPIVVVVPSPLPGREITWADVTAEYVRVLRDLGGIASTYGISLAFEPLGFGWCSVRTPRAAMEIIKAAGCDNIGLTLDAAHFYTGGGLMHELEMLDPNRILTFHLDDLEDAPREAISDALRILPGQGVVPLDDICLRLKNIGYSGPCSIELFRPEYWEWDPGQVAVAAHQAATKILSPYFSLE
jgi:2-keto-myo-inositol isomerase